MDGECEGWWQGTCVFAPADLQAAVVEGQTLIGSDLEEGACGSGINEGDKLEWISERWSKGSHTNGKTYGNVFVLHVPDALKNTPTDCVAQVFGGCLRVDIAKIDSAVHSLNRSAHGISHHIHAKARCTSSVRNEGREPCLLAHRRLGDE